MKVLFNALRPLQLTSGGNRVYTTELMRRLSRYDDIDLIIISSIENKAWIDEIAPTATIRVTKLKSHLQGLPSERKALIKAVAIEHPDIVHSPVTLLPLWRPACPTVVTIHDLSFFDIPQGVLKGLYKRLIYKYTTNNADIIITISKFSEQMIIKHYPKTDGHIRVIWHGQKISEQPQSSHHKNNASNKPYLITFGHWPHKNVEAAVHVFNSVRNYGKDIRLKIVGVGKYIDDVIYPLTVSLGISEYVDLLGEVADKELADLYRGATSLVFLSKYEGFGLPVIEAMASGCPAIVSDQGSLPEIAGKLGLIVGANDYQSASTYIIRLLENPDWAQSERNKAYEYASALTWDKSVKETVDVYYEILKSRNN